MPPSSTDYPLTDRNLYITIYKVKVKLYIFILMIAASVCFGCREIYEPSVEASQTVLVIEGLMTDEAKAYTVKLSSAELFSSSLTNSKVSDAKVAIIDEYGNVYSLYGLGEGVYKSNPGVLVGQPGHRYHLRIKTADSNVYESAPQLLLPNEFADTTYAEFSSQETLVENSVGETSKVTLEGIDLLTDIKNSGDSLPRFRYETIVTTEYSYFVPPQGPSYFCWETTFPNKLINLTEEKYQTSSIDIQKHSLGFMPTYFYHMVNIDGKDPEIKAYILNRIVKIIRYRINNETFRFYKNINELLSAESKIFDPIAFQLHGNITCKNNPQKEVFGFFEASSVKTRLISIKPGKKEINNDVQVEPPLQGGMVINVPPPFWVY